MVDMKIETFAGTKVSGAMESSNNSEDYTFNYQVREFLKVLHRGGNYSYWWSFPSKKSIWWNVDNPAPLPNGENVYFGVHPVRNIPTMNSRGEKAAPESVRSQRALIQVVNCLFADFDAKDFQNDKGSILGHIDRIPFKPSVLIDSGGGYHAYWLFTDPFGISEESENKECDINLIGDIQSSWIDEIRADPGARDLARVLRVPGTQNYKYFPPMQVDFVWCDLDRLYEIADFITSLNETESNRRDRKILSGGPIMPANQNLGIHPREEADTQRVKRALDRLSAWRCDEYAAWVNVGMALSELGEEGFQMWDIWSQGSGKYKAGETGEKWKTFKPGQGLGLGSLYHWASEDSGMAFDFNAAPLEDAIPTFEQIAMIENEDTAAGISYTDFNNMPELPEVGRLPEAMMIGIENAGRWLTDYIDFAGKASPMSPAIFNEILGLTLLSTAVARRVYVRASNKVYYPNLYSLIVANSTLYAKSTALDFARELLERAGLNFLMLPVGITPQSLVSEMGIMKPETFERWDNLSQADWERERLFAAQRSWIMDEASSLLDSFDNQNTADMLGHVLKLYDCPNILPNQTIKRGRETARFCYLSICGPTTPAAMRHHLANKIRWGDGLFARFIFVTPETDPIRKFFPKELEIPGSLIAPLHNFALERLPKKEPYTEQKPPDAMQAVLANGVWERWDGYHAALFDLCVHKKVSEKLYPNYGRFHDFAMRISMLLASIDWSMNNEVGDIVIGLQHWARAQVITEGYRASLHRMVEDSNRPLEDESLENKVMRKLEGVPGGITSRELSQALNMSDSAKRFLLDNVLERMMKDGIIRKGIRNNKRGRRNIEIWQLEI